MVIDRITAFLIMYVLTTTPVLGSQKEPRNPNDLMANSALASRLVLGSTLEEQVQENYAAKVVDDESSRAQDAYNAIGKPDGRYAIINPGDSLALRMATPFAVRNLGDIVGRVVSEDGEYSLAVPVRIINTDARYPNFNVVSSQAQDKFAWMMCIPSSQGGFRLPIAPQNPIDEIKIINIGENKLKIDAVIGYGN